MTHNLSGYDRPGTDFPWAGFAAGAALVINSELNDRAVAQGQVPPWSHRHPIVVLVSTYIGLVIAIPVIGGLAVLYCLAGGWLSQVWPGHDTLIGLLQLGIPIYAVSQWRYKLAERRWNPDARPGPGQWK